MRRKSLQWLVASIVISISTGACASGGGPGPSPSPKASPTPPAPVFTPSVSALSEEISGMVVYSRGDDVWTFDLASSKAVRLTRARGPEFDPSWSPDGKLIAYRDSRRGINVNDEIYVMRADGSDQRNLTRNPANDWGPAWSPDRTRIAFNSDRAGIPQIYVMDTNGGHVHRLNEIEGEYPAWSPDGARIAFMSQRPDAHGSNPNYDVFVMNSDGTGLRQLTDWPGEDGWPAWSPEGTIAFQTSHDDRGQSGDIGPYFDIYVMNADGSDKRRVTALFGEQPVWSRDGKLIMFHGGPLPLRQAAVYVMNRDGSGLTKLPFDGGMVDWHQP